MITILQISDAHLSPRSPLFQDNLAEIAAWAAASPPDLVIASGDLSLDGAGQAEDLKFAAGLLRALPAPLLAIPGNHDVGSHPRTMPRQPVDAARLARFRALVGADRWLRDLPGWRLVGLDTEIMGTGLPDEAEQAGFIAMATTGIGDRRLALFLHKPVFVTAPEEPVFDYWSVPPAARSTLAPLLGHPALRLVASGHLHLHREEIHGAVRYAWAPALSFVVAPEDQPGLPGERPCGALLHRLHADHVETSLLSPPGLRRHWINDIRDLTYPRGG
ncbi:phosphohydrolase [Siccirubricoccus deserti]|uniref:Metallophosphoesterase n=1 Tax=Siccirubricoccus deserti TaxID=2013562 RepID=A0A9X0R2A0_9PROT|nr:metallophosphoesterase [Siccirubricoccus deserti]MBC4017073.1 metallophosphoesterase [Siccirubricoccus deserti]GGC56356.1 phosphohydrolase [Siccirubricoccus deserti]